MNEPKVTDAGQEVFEWVYYQGTIIEEIGNSLVLRPTPETGFDLHIHRGDVKVENGQLFTRERVRTSVLNEVLVDDVDPEDVVDWNAIWIALQDLGATMHPLLKSGNVPDWAIALSEAMDEAQSPLESLCPNV